MSEKQRQIDSDEILDNAEQAGQHMVVSLLERTGAENVFGTAEGRADFLADHTPQELEAFMNRLNGVVRGIPQSRRVMDGAGHISMHAVHMKEDEDGLHTYEPPTQADRKPLMYEAYAAAREIKNPARAATMLGLVANAVHPYMDGNGRSTRVAYSLLTRGYDGSERDKQYYEELLQNGNRSIVDLDPTEVRLPERAGRGAMAQLVEEYDYTGPIPTYDWGGYRGPIRADGTMEQPNYEDRTADDLMVDESVSEPARKVLHDVLTDEGFNVPVLMRYMFENDIDPQPYIKQFSAKRAAIMLDELLPTLDDEAIVKLHDIQSDIKREYIRSMIRLFRDGPEGGFADKLVNRYRPAASVDEAA